MKKMKNFDKLTDLASMIYMASAIKEFSQEKLKDEYIYRYPGTDDKMVIVTADKVTYYDLNWSISFSISQKSITIRESYLSDFKQCEKVFKYTLNLLLMEKSKQLLKENHEK